MDFWFRLFVSLLFLLFQGCATNLSSEPSPPRTCPGIPPATNFGLSTSEVVIFNNMRLIHAMNAVSEQNWERAENLYMEILSIKKTTGYTENPAYNYTAHGLIHVLCMQGKYDAADEIAVEYNVPF